MTPKTYVIQTIEPVDKDVIITNITISLEITGIDVIKSGKSHKSLLLQRLADTFNEILGELQK